jgi:hypothetical protein
MRIRCGIAPLAILFALAIQAAPPLTTIEDTLYKADGSRFSGVAFVEWKSFQAADFSNIATHTVTVTILNGVIRVQLVPTTNASAGAYYSVRYNSDGRIQFDETWAVPPSDSPLKLKDVRVLSGSGGGQVLPPPAVGEILESDVVGLVDDLAARPLIGPGYAPSRTAYVNETGALEAVSGGLSDCVRVDGTAGPCDVLANPGPEFVDGETPAGLINGSNAAFTLASTPSTASSLHLYRNGVLQKLGLDYTLAGNAITFATGSVPGVEDVLLASYRLAGISGLSGGGAGLPQVLCSSTGTRTTSTSLVSLGSCTVPQGVLRAGDRVEIRFSYSHEGSVQGFTYEVHWGSTAIVSRGAGAGDASVAGHANAGVHSGGAQWDVQSWGNSLALAVGSGNASDSLSSPLTIGFLGKLASGTSETISLQNFTVVRYLAVSNP